MRAGIAILALVVLLQPVLAQGQREQQTGSLIGVPQRARIPDTPGMDKTLRSRLIMADFARCVIDRNRRKVDQALSLDPGADYVKAVVALSADECLDSGEIRFQPIVIRGPLFKELYLRREAARRGGHAWVSSVRPIDLSARITEPTRDSVQLRSTLALGACIAAKSPDVAREVVLQPTASAAQDRAMAAITPIISSCLIQGITMRLGKQVVENALAEVLYRGVADTVPAANTTAEGKS